MAILRDRTDEELLEHAHEVYRECDTTPVGVLALLVELTRRLGAQQRKIDRLEAFAFGPRRVDPIE